MFSLVRSPPFPRTRNSPPAAKNLCIGSRSVPPFSFLQARLLGCFLFFSPPHPKFFLFPPVLLGGASAQSSGRGTCSRKNLPRFLDLLDRFAPSPLESHLSPPNGGLVLPPIPPLIPGQRFFFLCLVFTVPLQLPEPPPRPKVFGVRDFRVGATFSLALPPFSPTTAPTRPFF